MTYHVLIRQNAEGIKVLGVYTEDNDLNAVIQTMDRITDRLYTATGPGL